MFCFPLEQSKWFEKRHQFFHLNRYIAHVSNLYSFSINKETCRIAYRKEDTFQSYEVTFSEAAVVLLTQPLFLWPALKESNTVSVCLRVRQM